MASSEPVRVLRPSAPAGFMTGQVFEDYFVRAMGPAIDVRPVALGPWAQAALPDDCGATSPTADFDEATRGFDFVCPDFNGIPLLPAVAAARNRSSSSIRLLVIAHSPGAYLLEWALLRPLLRTGDVIVAPSASAGRLIEVLCPALLPFVRVVPHPVPPIGVVGARGSRRVVALSRLHPAKLLHRLVDAAAVLTRDGVPFRLDIAGPDADARGRSIPYANALRARIERLDLGTCVRLVGEVGGGRRAELLSHADIVVNLSVAVEESFGKTVVEALSCGIPVLGTAWDGLPETIGEGGQCLPVIIDGLVADVEVDGLAQGIAGLLDAPPSADTCRQVASNSAPDRAAASYKAVLDEARDRDPPPAPPPSDDEPGAPPDGLLAFTAPLQEFGWHELMVMHAVDVRRRLRLLAGNAPPSPSDADEVRVLLLNGTRSPVQRFMAGAPVPARVLSPRASPHRRADRSFVERVADAAIAEATASSRLACLGFVAVSGPTDLLERGLVAFEDDGGARRVLEFSEVELLRRRGQYAEAYGLLVGAERSSRVTEQFPAHLHQLTAVCEEWGAPALALPWLRDWLEQFPDSPEAGRVWLDRHWAAALAGEDYGDEARTALERASALLGRIAERAPNA